MGQDIDTDGAPEVAPRGSVPGVSDRPGQPPQPLPILLITQEDALLEGDRGVRGEARQLVGDGVHASLLQGDGGHGHRHSGDRGEPHVGREGVRSPGVLVQAVGLDLDPEPEVADRVEAIVAAVRVVEHVPAR